MLIQPLGVSSVLPSMPKTIVPVEPAPPEPVAAPITDTVENGDEEGRAEGVLRLLEEGHFNGVANVRLRINFFDELAARARSDAAAAATEGAAELSGTVAAKLGEVASGLELDAAAADALGSEFQTAVDESVAAFTSAEGSADTAGLTDALKNAFNSLMVGLREMLAPTTPPVEDPETTNSIEEPIVAASESGEAPPESETPPADAPAQDVPTAPDPEELLNELTSLFEAGLQTLVDSVRAAAILPDPEPPVNGKGGAFEKFLAIYNDLRGVVPQVDEVA